MENKENCYRTLFCDSSTCKIRFTTCHRDWEKAYDYLAEYAKKEMVLSGDSIRMKDAKNAVLNHKDSEHCTIHLDRENPSTDGYIRIDKGDGFYAEYQIRDEAFLEDLFGKILYK